MTRLFSDALADLAGGGVNEETERLFDYHQATKHTYDSVRTNAHFLDWRNQPDPFRTYEGAPLISFRPNPASPRPARSPQWPRWRKDENRQREQS